MTSPLVGDVLRPVPALDRHRLAHTLEGRAVLATEASLAPLREALTRDWKSARVAPVTDTQLTLAVDVLWKYHLDEGFFGDRLQGMKHLEHLEKEDFLEAELTPNRNGMPQNRHSMNPAECPLCNTPDTTQRGLSWRNYVVWPNAYPYVPAAQQHVVILPARHQGQGFSKQILGDMMDYQRLASKEAPVSLHYNGIAGNSQYHLHWQASRVTFPVQRELDAGRLGEKTLRRDPHGGVDTYERNYSAGFVVHGSKKYVEEMADRIVRCLDQDPLTRSAYNLTLLQPRGREERLVIIPRAADNLRPQIDGLEDVGFGAYSFSGLLVVRADHIPVGFAEKAQAAASMTVVPPSKFKWLDAFAAAAP